MYRHRFHPSLLREYDIRGIVGETLFKADAVAVGRGFGAQVMRDGGRCVAVGYDGRLSSPDLEDALVKGLTASGIDVIRIGLTPTPMLYFAVHELGVDGGIQVTGSHNPPSHNGFKMMAGQRSFFGDRIQQLGKDVSAGDLTSGDGQVEFVDVFDVYIDRITRDFAGSREIDVAWDAGNGAAGPAMEAVAARIPGRQHCLYSEIDGNFPNHHPDPTIPENLVDLIRTVREGGYEIGIGFDGDGDRIGVVDGLGRIIWGDQILQFLAADVLRRHPGATIISDVKSSQLLFDEIGRLGGKPLMWRTGHSLIKDKMIETEAPLSGEMSGHIFYKDKFYGHDDALYVAIRLLDILAKSKSTMSEWRDCIPTTFTTPEVRFDCADEAKFDVVARVAADLSATDMDVDTTDGVRVNREGGWWLLRASNTQAVLVARAEARSAELLEELKEDIRRYLERGGINAPSF
ncbi:MAG: phosphomannomutase/phosphoglucomutase [Pseudomonadota bacterium]